MNNILQMVENEQTSEFYPTPQELVQKMIEGIDWRYIHTILEPSAGKGDIIREIARKEDKIYNRVAFDVDCIEFDPNLRQILKYNFGERRTVLREEKKIILSKRKYAENRYGRGWTYFDETTKDYEPLPPNEIKRVEEIEEEERTFFSGGIHIVHDNFLTYTPYKQYDLIIMNPPFSNGDIHLLKALDMQKNGGNIVCLLNAETLKNPYTETRRELLNKLTEYDAVIEYIENAFVSAERKTAVEVALIKVSIPQVQEESDIYNRMQEAERVEEFDFETTELEVTDLVKAAVNRFKVEVKSGLELIRQYRALIPYMSRSFGGDSWDNSPILRLTDSTDRGYESVSVNDYVKAVRLKYWKALLSNPKFTERLTSKLQKEYRERVGKLADYDFSEFNIQTLTAEMNANVKTGIKNEIIAMFDRLTEEHSWYPECTKNRHLYDGWKTNKAHKIGNKVIIPCHGVFDDWDGKPRTYYARNVLEDIERILNFLDGNMTQEIDTWASIDVRFKEGITKNIPCKYFTATFYKKGTVHLTFTCPELIERFNIYAAQQKAWLPPSYGKKAYKNMTEEEKAVIDSFQGEQAYNEVLAKSNYYLAPVTNNQMVMLG